MADVETITRRTAIGAAIGLTITAGGLTAKFAHDTWGNPLGRAKKQTPESENAITAETPASEVISDPLFPIQISTEISLPQDFEELLFEESLRFQAFGLPTEITVRDTEEFEDGTLTKIDGTKIDIAKGLFTRQMPEVTQIELTHALAKSVISTISNKTHSANAVQALGHCQYIHETMNSVTTNPIEATDYFHAANEYTYLDTDGRGDPIDEIRKQQVHDFLDFYASLITSLVYSPDKLTHRVERMVEKIQQPEGRRPSEPLAKRYTKRSIEGVYHVLRSILKYDREIAIDSRIHEEIIQAIPQLLAIRDELGTTEPDYQPAASIWWY